MSKHCLLVSIMTIIAGADFALGQSDSASATQDTLLDWRDQHVGELLDQSSNLDEGPIKDLAIDSAISPPVSSHLVLRSRISERLHVPEGYLAGKYGGSRLKMYNRLLFRSGRYSAGLLMTKDPGEVRAGDFVSGNLSFSGNGILSNIVVGDYHLEAAQGIALWRGVEYAKGSDVLGSAMKHGRGTITALSADETKFLRGVAATLSFGQTSATLFASERALGATFDSAGAVTSFYTAGVYRTAAEEAKRNTLRERMTGVRVGTILFAKHELGMTFYSTGFTRELFLDEGHRFRGNGYYLFSVDYDIRLTPLDCFGEWAVAQSTVGGIAGIRFHPSQSAGIVASFRTYPSRFVSLHGNGFGEGIESFNEQGLYFGVEVALTRSTSVSCFLDRFTFSQFSSSSPFSITGHDLHLRIASDLSRGLRFGVQYRRSTQNGKDTIVDPAGLVLERTSHLLKNNLRVEADYHVSSNVDVRLRVEKTFLDDDGGSSSEQGLLVYTDLLLHHSRKLMSNFRLIFFGTDSYSSRLSEYERDLDGVSSVPSLYGSGIRWYLLTRYRFTTSLSFSVKYSDLLRDDVRYIGSELEEIRTNHDNRFSAQVDIEL